MKINFTPMTDILYTLHCTSQYNWQDLQNELLQQTWMETTPSDGTYEWAVSVPSNKIITPNLKNITQFLKSNDFKKQLLDILFSNKEFLNIWGSYNRHQFSTMTNLLHSLVRTPPNFINHPPHLDSECQVAFGMIYFINGDDPAQSTYFLTDSALQPQRIPTGMGHGWLVINNERAVHYGSNNTDQYRYCLKFFLNLKL